MSREKSEVECLMDISAKLDCIVGLLLMREIADDTSAVVKRLYEMGFSARSIARIVGLTENAVNIRLTRLRKEAGKQRK